MSGGPQYWSMQKSTKGQRLTDTAVLATEEPARDTGTADFLAVVICLIGICDRQHGNQSWSSG